ncbi:MAG: DUF6527 family protein [Bacteroidota bacterium]
MKKHLQHKFVEFIPQTIEEGMLYISLEYCTAIHKCVCGCANEVVTPISPTDWQVTFDGESVSLYPSIGNWNFECQSHYFIINSEIKFSRKWSKDKIEKGRDFDEKKKKTYYKRNSK